MKPSPEYDFPVSVWKESKEHPSPVNAMYAGIYSVRLNYSVSIEFVPAFERSPWPPGLSGDVDEVRSCDEARRMIVACSSYVVTPDDARSGSIETFPDPGADMFPDTEGRPISMFYLRVAEFDELTREIEGLCERLHGIYDSVPVSELNGTLLARTLLDRILPSGQLSERALYMLGRGK